MRGRPIWPIFTLPPPDAHSGRWVIVMHPPAVGTVISVAPDGVVTLAPPGTQGPSEIAVQQPDRFVYAPEGDRGAVFVLPSGGDDTPNA
jgi:DNA-binding beta-propeller fold protein YncE